MAPLARADRNNSPDQGVWWFLGRWDSHREGVRLMKTYAYVYDGIVGRTLPPGIYASSTGTFDIGGIGRTTANLTLDAGGDANAV